MKHKLLLLCFASALVVAPSIAASTQKKAQTSAAEAKSGQLIDINSASEKDLESLPGVGKATAGKIVAGRPYSSADDLSRAGVSQSTIDKIRPLVTAGPTRSVQQNPPARSTSSQSTTGSAERSATRGAGATEAPAPPSPGMVWVNTKTKVFHQPGDPFYGKTKHGKYMTQADALKAGYRAAK